MEQTQLIGHRQALAVADIDEAIGLLPSAYDRNSKFLMSKKTFYNQCQWIN